MRVTAQVRAMDDYFHSLLLDDALLREGPDDEPPAPVLQLQPQPAPLPEVVAAPYLETDNRLAQLSELLAQVSQVQDEMDVLSHEEVHVEPFQLEVEAEPEPVEVALVTPEVIPVIAEPVALALAEPALAAEPEPAPAAWENLDTGNEFQALFFDVAGVTFAVPLTRSEERRVGKECSG